MKKEELIEELKKEIEATKNVLNCEEHFSLYAKGKRVGLEFGWMFAEKLDEPELPVIPQFVGDYIEKSKTATYSLLGTMSHFTSAEDIHVWLRENQETFARAWLDGYTIEPESIKTRQVLVKFFDNEEYRTELTEESARELIEFLEANKK